jgi:hypothetical protein
LRVYYSSNRKINKENNRVREGRHSERWVDFDESHFSVIRAHVSIFSTVRYGSLATVLTPIGSRAMAPGGGEAAAAPNLKVQFILNRIHAVQSKFSSD